MLGRGFTDGALGISEMTRHSTTTRSPTPSAHQAGGQGSRPRRGGRWWRRAGTGLRIGGGWSQLLQQECRRGGRSPGGHGALLSSTTLTAFFGTAVLRHRWAVRGVAQGAFILASQLAAVGPAAGVAASGLLALTQVGGTLMISMKGVGEALRLGVKSIDANPRQEPRQLTTPRPSPPHSAPYATRTALGRAYKVPRACRRRRRTDDAASRAGAGCQPGAAEERTAGPQRGAQDRAGAAGGHRLRR